MEDPPIYLELETLMPRVTKGDQEARDAVMRDEWMLGLLNDIAEWAERERHIEADEHGKSILEIVEDRIRAKLHTVTNPNQARWDKCVGKWSYTVAARLCEDVRKKRTRLIEKHRRAVEHECVRGKEYGVRIFEPASPAPSPEEELERKEQAPLCERLESKIHRTTLKAREAASPEEKQILNHWLEGRTLEQIHELTGISRATVQRKLKKIQKAIVAEVEKGVTEEIGEARTKENGVAEFMGRVVTDRKDLGELIASSTEEVRGASEPHAPAREAALTAAAPRPKVCRRRRRRRRQT